MVSGKDQTSILEQLNESSRDLVSMAMPLEDNLVVSFHEFHQAGRFPDTEDEQSCRERIERAGVADPLHARATPDHVDHVMGGLARLFVDQ